MLHEHMLHRALVFVGFHDNAIIERSQEAMIPPTQACMGCHAVVKKDSPKLASLLSMPADAEPVAILCLGPVPDFPDRPSLELDGWALGRPLAEFVSENGWGQPPRAAT